MKKGNKLMFPFSNQLKNMSDEQTAQKRLLNKLLKWIERTTPGIILF